MPLSLLAALFLAFGIEGKPGAAAALPTAVVAWRAAEALAGVLVVGVAAMVLGWWVSRQVARSGYASSGLRRGYLWGTRGVGALSLAVYAATLYLLAWPDVVQSLVGGRSWPVAADVLVLVPFILAELVGWWGLFAAEQALRILRMGAGADLKRHLVLKARQTFGLLLPVLLVYSVGQDIATRAFPSAAQSSWAQPAGLGLMAALVLAGSPVFLRLAWPTSPLPCGPLRDRLDVLARRVGFRCTDILVWDTGHVLVNAGVTGTLPWFRYVLLSDALVENLTDEEVAAVFGHEIGHIAHRHLLSFGLFFLGAVGVLAVIRGALDQYVLEPLGPALASRYPGLGGVLEGAALLLALVLFFFFAFGLVSRRFERQADLFGCRAVSCGNAQCPPHRDGDHAASNPPATPAAVCPAGIRTFVSALTNVAALNGMRRDKPSWRHGSIARRVAFLESLEGRPEAERQFQRGVARLRLGLAVVLSLAWWWACAAHWLQKI